MTPEVLDSVPTTARSVTGRLPWWIAVPAAALGGLLLDVANPGAAVWPLVFPAVFLIVASWWQQSIRGAMLAGAAAGAVFWMTQLSWLTLYLGPVPWLGLSAVMIAWFVLQGAATAAATRGLAALRGRPWKLAKYLPPRVVLPLAQALAVAGIWVLREGVQGNWPYDGFAWARIAHLFADSPLGALVSWLGFAGLSGLIVFAVAVIVAIIAQPRTSAGLGGRAASGTVAALVAAAAVFGLAFVPPAGLEQTGTLRVGAVQGNSKSGIFDNREAGDVYADHVRGTEELLDELEAAGDRVDVIVWPENSAEFALPDNPLRAREIALLSRRAEAPIVVGTILAGDDGTYTNSSVVWGPEGLEDSQAGNRYDKRYPVPFAEYMPNRSFFRALAPDLVDLVQLEYEHGEFAPVHGVQALGREVVAGVAICFDIIFDDQAEQMIDEGAEVIFAPTNNADFGRTDESVQQLQIARLRAIETGRAVVNISTVGTSRIIAPDGRNLDALDTFTRGAMVADVPLVTGETPALRFGAHISTMWMIVGGAGVIVGSVTLVRRRYARAS
ncbi:apolipoprotein N-acyltransferase [Leucobacter sp. G161]|uniref:apolipoprotein N-acyltransferase n=1 Tax=Leucobacter sp. G161 TaxID=663704 RepID=UPI00073CC577|nr:apolipoprotein N-acyltransferase [Leucobacter sp. G161]KUF06733.1 apolipoprotein N-acyltransferase [Leucobacter sp. G161]